MAEATYGTRAEVKNIVGITSSETRFDTDIDNYLLKASRYIDNVLRPHTTVPVTTNNTLDDIANDMAAGMYREDQAGLRGEQVMRDTARARAETTLKDYVTGTYHSTDGVGDRFTVYRVNK